LDLSAEASEEEDRWGGHDPKTGRNAIEEEDNIYKYACCYNSFHRMVIICCYGIFGLME
jgi:hypothetical protein